MNKKEKRYIFKKKHTFMKRFNKFINRDYLFLKDNFDKFNSWIVGKNKFIAKPNEGAVGKGIEIIDKSNFKNSKEIYKYLKENKLNLIEELINQNSELNNINPASVNTLRIVTVRNNKKTHIVGALLRMSKDTFVDNLARGGIAAPIDIEKGKIIGAAVSKDPFDREYIEHPITNKRILDFIIPYWKETKKMVLEASKIEKDIRTVGWDIAITQDGPELIEGNDNWDKTLWQIPYKEGKINELKKYMV